MENNEPATKRDLQTLRADTKADLQALRVEIKADLQALRVEAKADLQAQRDELLEAMRDIETKLLTAFYSFAEGNHKRLTEVERTGAAFADRVATLEGRVTALEKRLNMPPPS